MKMHRLLSAAAFVALLSAPVVAEDLEKAASLEPSMLGKIGAGADGGILSSLTLGGSVDVGYTHNFNNSEATSAAGSVLAADAENAGRVFDTRHNEFTLHNVILNIASPVSDDKMFGFALTPTFGEDGNVTDIDGSFGGDLDVLDANIQARVMGATVKVGKFQTRAGGEVIASVKNPNYSRSFLFGNAIPYTHTGVEVEKGFSERQDGGDLLTVALGYANGWDNGVDTNNSQTFMATAIVAPSELFDVTFNWFFGPNGAGNSSDQTNLIDIVLNFNVGEATGVEGLGAAINLDWAGNEGSRAGTGYAEYYGVSGIVTYECENPFTESGGDKLLFALRTEFVDDVNGFITGAATQIFSVTGTVGYRPNDWFLVRGELRGDTTDTTFNAFQDGASSHQTTLAINTVFSF